MARLRTIKPEFWTDSKTGTLSDRATKVLIGMMNHSDDFGLIELDPFSLKAKIYPYSSETPTALIEEPVLAELLPRRLLILFSWEESGHDPKPFLWIRHFSRHQKVDKIGKPAITGFDTSNDRALLDVAPIPAGKTIAQAVAQAISISELTRSGKSGGASGSGSFDVEAALARIRKGIDLGVPAQEAEKLLEMRFPVKGIHHGRRIIEIDAEYCGWALRELTSIGSQLKRALSVRIKLKESENTKGRKA